MPSPNHDHLHLERLRDFYVGHRHIPSFQDIADLLGFASKTAASQLMQRLGEEGFVERIGRAWVPTQRFFERSLVDATVRAGAPEHIDNVSSAPFLVDQYLVRKPSTTVMITVKGDSMQDAGIHDGDIVAVERNRLASAGDLVVAIVDNEFTLKELGFEKGLPVLIPHNKAYPVIRPKGDLEIYGVVGGLMRRY